MPPFVVAEGIEGSGKSTLLAGLAERLRSHGHALALTREPGGTPAGDAIREIFLDRAVSIAPLTEALLVNAARAQHVRDVIRPALDAGQIVLCDRFTDSTLAYQGYGRGLDLELLRSICRAAASGLEPDLVLVVDVPVELSRARTTMRPGAADRLEREGDAFYERVRRGFLELGRSPRHVVLDGALSPERLLDDALRALNDCIGVRVS